MKREKMAKNTKQDLSLDFGSFDFETLKTNGIKVNYLYVCERKLWFFDRGIHMEYNSEKVLIAKLFEIYSYPHETKRDILIDNLIRIDIFEDNSIREVKYSDKMHNADRIQLLYYLYYLKKLGIERKGILNYPRIRKKEEVIMTPSAEKEVEEALKKVHKIVNRDKPPPIEKKPYCTKCAYYELCWG